MRFNTHDKESRCYLLRLFLVMTIPLSEIVNSSMILTKTLQALYSQLLSRSSL